MTDYYTGFHGSPGASFQTFDPELSGNTSGYAHARGAACLTTSLSVAQGYAEGEGFVCRFGIHFDNPLVLYDSERDRSIPYLLEFAKNEGHDGVVLIDCAHSAVSPEEPSTVIFLFNPERARRLEVIQEPPEEEYVETAPRRAQRAR